MSRNGDARAIWTNDGTHAGLTEWTLTIGGVRCGALERERPTRWAAGDRRGLARDATKPWVYSGEAFGPASRVARVDIPDGSGLRVAKALVEGAARVALARSQKTVDV